MIVDIHTHTFPDRIAAATIDKLQANSHTHAFTDGSVGQLRASMAAAGVDRSVVLPVATNIRQVDRVNNVSAELNAEGKGILSFGCIHPDYPDWKMELSRIQSLGLQGIKLHPIYQGVQFDDPRYLRILDRCGELGLVVLTHAGLDVGFPGRMHCPPHSVLNALKQIGPVTLILAHMGGWFNWDEVEELLVHTNVCLDTSFSFGKMTSNGDGYYGPTDLELMPDEQAVRMIRTFGAHRIFFGTDSPWDGQAEALATFRALPLTKEEQDAILGGNAQRLLRL